MRFRMWMSLAMLLAAGSVAVAFDPTQGRGKNAAAEPISATEEADALTFVRNNHAELAELLTQLKSGNPRQYEQAIRDLSKTAATLAETQKRDPRRYELDLKAWQVNSRVQVLAARLAMTPDPELEQKLKEELLAQIDTRLEQQELERERLKARLDKLETAIEKTRSSREQQAERALAKLKGGIPKRPDAKTAKKPAQPPAKPAPASKQGAKP